MQKVWRVTPLWILFFVFLTLKLTETIDWSWWWITAPLWGGLVLVFVLIFGALALAALVAALARR